MVDPSVFEFVHLCKAPPLRVQFSNLQLWAAKQVFPDRMYSSTMYYRVHTLRPVTTSILENIVPFEALNQTLACLQHKGEDTRPLSLIEVAESMFCSEIVMPNSQRVPG